MGTGICMANNIIWILSFVFTINLPCLVESSEDNGPIKKASLAMMRATYSLSDDDKENALRNEQEALNHLYDALGELLHALNKIDPKAAENEFGRIRNELINKQRKIQSETDLNNKGIPQDKTGTPDQKINPDNKDNPAEKNTGPQSTSENKAGDKSPENNESSSKKQKDLAGEVRRAANLPGLDKKTVDAFKEAAKNMDVAAEALKSGDTQKAKSAQQKAQNLLSQATYSNSESNDNSSMASAASNKKQSTSGKTVDGQNSSGMGGERNSNEPERMFEVGNLNKLPKDWHWTIALPAKDRAQIEHAQHLRSPPKYAKLINLYYRDLSKSSSNN